MKTSVLKITKLDTLPKVTVPVMAVAVVLALFILPLILPKYYVYILTTIFMSVLLASSLNLAMGYGGLLQLHHAVFFGVGSYGFVLMLTKTSWPFWVTVVAGPVVGAGIALLIGLFCLRLRGIYFGILTLVLGQLVWSVVHQWTDFTGGDNGISSMPLPDMFNSIMSVYYLTLAVVTIFMVLLYLMIKSPFGLTLVAIRDNPMRASSIGVDIKLHQLLAFVISGFVAGVAGVLFVFIEHSISTNLLSFTRSLEIVIMIILGGIGTFLGPVVGASLIILLYTFVSSYTDYWLLVLGVILLLLVLFLPQGLVGLIESGFARNLKRGDLDASS